MFCTRSFQKKRYNLHHEPFCKTIKYDEADVIDDTLVRVLGKKKEAVMIFLETHDAGNIGVAGESVEDKRKGIK